MKTMFLILSLFMSVSANAKQLTQTDLGKVYGTGTQSNSVGRALTLKSGVYVVGDEDSKLGGRYHLLIENYVNNSNQFFALLVDKGLRQGSGTGQFFIGKYIKGGTSVMLSPVFVDSDGNLSSQAELNTRASVIEISLRGDAGKVRYPYMLQGHHGALNGQLLGMRAANTQILKFAKHPQKSIFNGASKYDSLVVTGSTVAMHNGYSSNNRFEMIPVNGDGGKIAALVNTEFDTMGEYMVSTSEVSKLAFFLQTGSGAEIFVVASPGYSPGHYNLNIYQPQSRTFMDVFFPGEE